MKLSILILAYIILIGCDTPGVLILNNKSDYEEVFITHVDASADVKKIELQVSPNLEENVFFGFGWRWTDDHIANYVEQVEKVEVISRFDTLRITNKLEMYNYFRTRRKGLFNKKIKIEIE